MEDGFLTTSQYDEIEDYMRDIARAHADNKQSIVSEMIESFNEATYSHHFFWQICNSCGWHEVGLGKKGHPMKVVPSCPRCHMDDMEEVTECLWILSL